VSDKLEKAGETSSKTGREVGKGETVGRKGNVEKKGRGIGVFDGEARNKEDCQVAERME
jgi:hypothetical protein